MGFGEAGTILLTASLKSALRYLNSARTVVLPLLVPFLALIPLFWWSHPQESILPGILYLAIFIFSLNWAILSIEGDGPRIASIRVAILLIPRTFAAFALGALLLLVYTSGILTLAFWLAPYGVYFLAEGNSILLVLLHSVLRFLFALGSAIVLLLFLQLAVHWLLFSFDRSLPLSTCLVRGFRIFKKKHILKFSLFSLLCFGIPLILVIGISLYQGFFDSTLLYSQSKLAFVLDTFLKGFPFSLSLLVQLVALEYYYGGESK